MTCPATEPAEVSCAIAGTVDKAPIRSAAAPKTVMREQRDFVVIPVPFSPIRSGTTRAYKHVVE